MSALLLALVGTANATTPLGTLEPLSTDELHALHPHAIELPTDENGDPVYGGHVVANNAWPDAAGIMFSNNWLDVECTGVLVAPDVVLTAGHCARGIERVILDTDNYEQGGEIIAVQSIHEYPNSQSSGYDIAALKLAEDATVEPRIIARDCLVDDIVEGADVTIVGYGAYDAQGNRYDSQLREGVTQIQDPECTDRHDGCNMSISPGGELGAGGNGVDSCFGDSGGPLYLETDRGTFVVGLTSRGYSWVNDPCGEGGIYVRPDAVIDWIESETGTTLPRPPCGDPPNPVAEPIYLPKNTVGQTQIDPNDPDGDDGPYTFAIETPPLNGSATIDEDGVLTFHPETNFKGENDIVISVTDGTGLTGEGTVVVKVMSKSQYKNATGQGCGCQSTGSPMGLAGALMVGLLALRRRR